VVDDVAFYGLDHVPASKRADLDYAFEPHDAAFAALVAHGLFTPFAHADWETETVLAASTVDFDVVLLGDNHAPGIERVGGIPVTYCGSTERVSTAERDGRGYNLVTFEDGEEVDVRRRAIETRPFVFVEVELADGEGGERVRERVRQHDLSEAVVVVEITGDGDPVTPASVEELACDRGALVARVTDRREFEASEGTEPTVEFADPDEAVRERVSELGLSPAALDVDDAVRGEVADTNVRETVKRRVRERLDDLSGFESASGTGPTAGETGDAETVEEPTSAGESTPNEESIPDEGSTGDPDSTGDGRVGADAPGDASADGGAVADGPAVDDRVEGGTGPTRPVDSDDASDATGRDGDDEARKEEEGDRDERSDTVRTGATTDHGEDGAGGDGDSDEDDVGGSDENGDDGDEAGDGDGDGNDDGQVSMEDFL
jgi:hypothetical protein